MFIILLGNIDLQYYYVLWQIFTNVGMGTVSLDT